MLKTRTKEQIKKFNEINQSYLSRAGRTKAGTDEVLQFILSIIPEIDDPALGFICVTNMCYRIAEDRNREKNLSDAEELFHRSQAYWKSYTKCQKSIRWATSATATLSTLCLLLNEPKKAKQVLDGHPSEHRYPAWDGMCPSHMNLSIIRLNEAIYSVCVDQLALSAMQFETITREVPANIAELSSSSNIQRLRHLFDIKTMNQILLIGIQGQHFALAQGNGSPFVLPVAKAGQSIAIDTKSIFPRISTSWIGVGGEYENACQKLNNISSAK